MTSDTGIEIRSTGRKDRRGEEGLLVTCSLALLQRRLIKGDNGEIRRFKIEKVVRGYVRSGRQKDRRRGGEKKERQESEINM